MNILRLIKIRVNPKLCRSRADIAHSSKDGLFHHVSEISRQFQLAGAFDHVHFHFQCRAADACPGKPRDKTDLIRLRHFIGQETARTEEFLKVAAGDGQPLRRILLDKAHGALAAHGGKLPFERAHAGLSGVAGDDFADGIVCEPDEFRAAELLHYTPGDDVYILYGTDSLALSYKVYDHMKEEAARHAQGGAEKEGQA